MNDTQRSKACVQNDLRFRDSPPLRLTSKLPLVGAVDFLLDGHFDAGGS
jgi:hypothetical protein